MANVERRRRENVEGDFFVDSTCIDCDHCRWLAPETFHRDGRMSAVHHQPVGEGQRRRALQALLTCPTGSIGSTSAVAPDLKEAQQSFPIPIGDEIYLCGYASQRALAATTYFIRRPEGNVLVDPPRFARPLIRRLEELGGVRYLFISHIDHIGEQQAFRDHFGCDRIYHVEDTRPSSWWSKPPPGFPIPTDDDVAPMRGAEVLIDGEEPVRLAEDLLLIPTPGHTKGHVALLYRSRHLFTGDHVFYSPILRHLAAPSFFNWYSWPRTIASIHKLAAYEFTSVLPGHAGGPFFAEAAEMRAQLERCAAWMERTGPDWPHNSFGWEQRPRAA